MAVIKPRTQSQTRRNSSKKTVVIGEQKKQIRKGLRRRVEEKIYELQLDTIILRENLANELFGDYKQMKDLEKQINKFELEKAKKEDPHSKPKDRVKVKFKKRIE